MTHSHSCVWPGPGWAARFQLASHVGPGRWLLRFSSPWLSFVEGTFPGGRQWMPRAFSRHRLWNLQGSPSFNFCWAKRVTSLAWIQGGGAQPPPLNERSGRVSEGAGIQGAMIIWGHSIRVLKQNYLESLLTHRLLGPTPSS